ncbi:MAG: hypothetical protein GQ534_07575 [Candidatus Delongbacteria bacterium]|nr:hypothetical protein [Candidatus Delongbacteria bacterium]
MKKLFLSIIVLLVSLSAETLFEIKDTSDNAVFSISDDGLRVFNLGDTLMVITTSDIKAYIGDSKDRALSRSFSISTNTTGKSGLADILEVTTEDMTLRSGVGGEKYTDFSPDNMFLGSNAGASRTTGSSNVFIGNNSGFSNEVGNYNIFLGYNSGFTNTASYNLFIGFEAGKNNLDGTFNSFIGYQSGFTNSSGLQNTANGFMTFHFNTIGNYNTAMGSYALYHNTTGTDNTAIGNNCLSSNTEGINNIAVGSSALQYTTTGDKNTAVGAGSLRNNITGNYNAALGNLAGYNATGSSNAFIGNYAGFNATGSSSAFIGYYAGYDATGSSNIAIGYEAGYETTGINDVFIGYRAGRYNTTASYTTGIGSWALYHNTTGIDNTAIGNNCLSSNTEGFRNIATGSSALQYTTTGDQNTANGAAALRTNIIGSNNTALGCFAGYSTTGSGNVFLGANAGYSETGSNKLYIDNSNTATPLINGDFSTNYLGINGLLSVNANNLTLSVSPGAGVDPINYIYQGVAGSSNVKDYAVAIYDPLWVSGSVWAVAYNTTSDKRFKKNIVPISNALSKISQIDGVYFEWNDNMLKVKNNEEPEIKRDPSKQIGFIAQDIEEVFPEMVSTDGSGYKSVDYSKMSAVLLEAVKEQQQQINMLIKEIETIKNASK